MAKEHDTVVLVSAVPAEGLLPGDVGTVVHVYRDGQAYEVEFMTLEGKTAAVITLEASQGDYPALDRYVFVWPTGAKLTGA